MNSQVGIKSSTPNKFHVNSYMFQPDVDGFEHFQGQ